MYNLFSPATLSGFKPKLKTPKKGVFWSHWLANYVLKVPRFGGSLTFYNNRTLKVRVGTALSDGRTILKGVPQGCVLSPLLFNIMMSDFSHPPVGVHLGLFADDIEMHAISK